MRLKTSSSKLPSEEYVSLHSRGVGPTAQTMLFIVVEMSEETGMALPYSPLNVCNTALFEDPEDPAATVATVAWPACTVELCCIMCATTCMALLCPNAKGEEVGKVVCITAFLPPNLGSKTLDKTRDQALSVANRSPSITWSCTWCRAPLPELNLPPQHNTTPRSLEVDVVIAPIPCCIVLALPNK